MAELKTSRPFQERFLDGFDRSQLRQEVLKVKPSKWSSSLRRTYASWALGGALALGGIGVPLKVGNMLHSADDARRAPADSTTTQPANDIAGDLQTVKNIADQVAGGVTGAVTTVATTAGTAPAKVAQQMASEVVQAPSTVVKNGETGKIARASAAWPATTWCWRDASSRD